MDYDASDDTSSASEGSLDVRVAAAGARKSKESEPTKKRKTTYYMRRDEIQVLQDELETLKAKLKHHEQRAPTPKPAPSYLLSNSLAANAFLSLHVDHNSLMIAGTQSMTSAYSLSMVQASGVVPLKSYIHLPVDQDERSAALSAIHEPKLQAAARFMAERTRYLDLRVNQRQVEQFELPNGDAAAMTFFNTHFTSGHSLRQVYDALMYFLVNQETCIFEQLGILTVRESDVLENLKFGQTRMLSSLPCGLEVECNIASFAKCVDATETTPAYAVGALDFVDLDDLYPYRSDFCLRKELTGAVTLHEVPSPTGGKPTVAMARWSYVRIPASTFRLSAEEETLVANDLLQWCDAITRIVGQQLTKVPPAA